MNLLSKKWVFWFALVVSVFCANTALAYPRVGRVVVQVHVNDTESWCCGKNWLGRCNCSRREAYNLYLRTGSFGRGDIHIAGTFYSGNWYTATISGLNHDFPLVKSWLNEVHFFNTSRWWNASAWQITVYDTSNNVMSVTYRGGNSRYGTWHGSYPASGMSINYDTPHDSSINSSTWLNMNWNTADTRSRYVAVSDADGHGTVAYEAWSNDTALFPNGSINLTARSGSGNDGSKWIELRPAANSFGTATIYIRTREGGVTRTLSFPVAVNRVRQAPSANLNMTSVRVRSSENFSFNNILNASDEYTPAGNLTVSVASLNTAVLPNSSLRVTRSGSNTSLIVENAPRPASNAGANAQIRMTVRDSDGDTTVRDVNILVTQNVRESIRVGGATGDSQGVSFERVGDRVTVSPGIWFDEGPLTIEAWVYLRSHKNWSRVIDFGNGPGQNNVLLATSAGQTGRPCFQVKRGASEQGIESSKQFPLNKWTHISAVINNGKGTMYMDGEKVAEGPMWYPENIHRQYNYLGRSNWGDGDWYLDGVLDEVRIWSEAREPGTIWEEAFPPFTPNKNGLVGYWNFDSGRFEEPNLSTASARSLGGSGTAYMEFPVHMPGIPKVMDITLNEDSPLTFGVNLNTELPGTPSLSYNDTPDEGSLVLNSIRNANSRTESSHRFAPLTNFNTTQHNDISMNAEFEFKAAAAGAVSVSGHSQSYPANAMPVRQRLKFRVNPQNDAPITGNDVYVELGGNQNDYLWVPSNGNPFSFSGTDSFTLEAWIRPTQFANALQTIMAKYDVRVVGYYFLAVNSEGKLALFREHAPWETVISLNSIPLNEWSHVAATFDGTKIRLYINGVLEREHQDNVAVGSSRQTPLMIGTRLFNGNIQGDASFKGGLDDLRIWNIARDGSELAANYRSVLSGFEEGLVGYYRLNEGVGIWALDNTDGAAKGYFADARLSNDSLWRVGAETVNLVNVPEDSTDFMIRVSAVDIDRDPVQLTINSQPQNGQVRLGSSNGQPVFLYTPRADFSGEDKFNFRASDGILSSVGTVDISVIDINDPPVVSIIGNQALEEEASLEYQIPFNVNDVDTPFASLTFSLESSDQGILPVSSLSVTGSGSSRNIKISSESGVYGSSTITLNVSDGKDITRQSFIVSLIPNVVYAAVELPAESAGLLSEGLGIDDLTRISGYSIGTASDAVERPLLIENLLVEPALFEFETKSGRISGTATGLNRTNTYDVGIVVTNGNARPYRRHRFYVDERKEDDRTGTLAGFAGVREERKVLPIPSTYRAAHPLQVNSVGTMVGYLVAPDLAEYPFRVTIRDNEITETQRLKNPANNGNIIGRATGINRYNVAVGYLIESGKKIAFRHDGSTLTRVSPPSGYVESEFYSINDDEIATGILRKSNGQTTAAIHDGTHWTLPPSNLFSSTWSSSESFAINNFQQVVGSALLKDGSRKAFLWMGGALFDLTDLQPEDSEWTFATARDINEQGQIVGLGYRRKAAGGQEQLVFLANPASVIGKRLVQPEGTVARIPIIELQEGGAGDNAQNTFFWSEVEKALYAIRPVKAIVKWHRNANLTSTSLDVVPRLITTIWPKEPERHVAGAPVIVEPEVQDSLYSYFSLHYSATPAATVDANTKVFNTSDRGTGHSVIRYLKTFGLPQDPLTQTNHFHVVRTRLWNDPEILDESNWTVGKPLVDAGHSDYPGRNGYLFFQKTALDIEGSDRAYDRETRVGSLIPVNKVNKEAPVNDNDLVVVWYKMNSLNVAWPYRPVMYQPDWPIDAPKLIISSQVGSNPNGDNPITPVTYPLARIYNQPDPALAGFNPNEEHAMLFPSSSGQAVFALRNDLNSIKGYSEPFVLLKYKNPINQEWAHKVYQVYTEEPPYSFSYTGTAGTEINPPYPLSALPLSELNYVSHGEYITRRDYRGKYFAKRAGELGNVNSDLVMRFFYPLQPGFWYDLDETAGADVAVGTFLPWLDRSPAGEVGVPTPVNYDIRWPDETPVLEVGESLFEAKKGLPGVADWASARIVYDSLNPELVDTWDIGPGRLTSAPESTARLYDPLSERQLVLGSSFEMPDIIRLQDASAGKKLFRDLPYVIQLRLTYDPLNKILGFKGYYDDSQIGEPLLLPNIMSETELARIQELDGTGAESDWDRQVKSLYLKTRNPNDLDLNSDGSADESFLVGYQYPITRTNFVAGTPVGYEYDKSKIQVESVPAGLKTLTAAIGDNQPMTPEPGRAVQLNGNGGLRVDWLPSDQLKSFTWETWATRDTSGIGQNMVLLSRGGSQNGILVQQRSDNYMEFFMGGHRIVSTRPLNNPAQTAGWHHWAGVYNALAGSMKLYLDGEVVAEGNIPASPVNVSGILYLGGDASRTSWKGQLDEVRIWHDVARDQSQLVAFRDQTLVSGQKGLVGYWNFDQVNVTSYIDISGDRQEGVIRGIVRSVMRGVNMSLDGLKSDTKFRSELFDEQTILPEFQTPTNNGELYAQRLTALIVPPMSGDYTFWISGDDDSELWLGENENESSKRLIASVIGWTGVREWEKYNTQKSLKIRLESGRAYYIEALHREGGGGDHVSVRWQLPNGAWENNDPAQVIPQSRLLPVGLSRTAKTYGSVASVELGTEAEWGIPPRFLTLMENDDPALAGLPVTAKVIALGAGPFAGDMKVLPPANVFDERLTLLASPDFAGQPEKFEFEWWYKPDSADFDKNLLPVIDPATGEVSNANGWILYTAGSGKGKNNITLGEGGESGLLVLSDNWFLARYRGYNVGRDRNVWSPWIGDPSSLSTTWPMLAEGWVKRVVRGLNPFDERVKNLSEASASARISMLEQAGTRYEGDIAFNPSADAINKVGLIEAYETVLRQARSLSTDGTPPVNYAPANNALLLMASRIADLYTLLGNEAVADAVDPTIGFSTSSEYGSIASSIFAFQNQLESLLEEELTLLRGRDDSSAGVQGAPVYNRLLWNFTMGEGEVAYTQVYGIKDVNGDGGLNEYDASIMYPQGHGDAWGHYLTATKTYYDLLRNDSFTWVPRSESVLLAGVPIKVDFLDERKFALAASYKAKAGQQIVDLTYRNKYVQSPQGQWQGYSDTDSDRAWGVDEWATRAGVGAYLDWAMANAILPAVDPNPSHTGIDKIDRTTVKELREIASYFGKIQQTVNDADQGLNPLGLAQGVVPFDLDPTFVTADDGESLTHFEQIYDRARTALDNAVASFNQVNVMNVGIRQSSDQARDMDYDLKQQEIDYNSQLVEFFGYPYAGDIGPGKTYPSGYDGPDLLHYMYVETKEYDSSNSPAGSSWTGILSKMDTELATWGNLRLRDQDLLNSQNAFSGTDIIRVDYPYSASGYAFEAPSSWGMRRAPGEVQLAISDLVQAETRLKQALKEYDALLKDIDEAMYRLDGEIDFKKEEITLVDNAKGTRTDLLSAQMGLKITQTVMNRGANLTDGLADSIAEAIPKNLIAGLAAGGDVAAPARGAAKASFKSIANTVFGLASDASQVAINGIDFALAKTDMQLELDILNKELKFEHQQALKDVATMMRQEAPLRIEIYKQREVVNQTASRLQKLIAEGQRIIEQRTVWRKQFAGQATEARYRDMAFRVFRDDAIRQYRSQMDLASRYAYLAASAYDYEANQLNTGANSGEAFLTDIIRRRSPGAVRNGIPLPGVPGLADPLARMAQNFEVLKTQMGFNNPQTETGRFSLRSELFRIRKDQTGDDLWRSTLKKSIVADLWEVDEFRRFCRPMAPETSGAQPALVIKFPTSVTFGLNFFGWPLAGGDSSYDPSQFATKIRSAGVWFEGYDGNGLSMTPRVYVFPAGADVLRSPDGNNFETRMWRVIDQKLPLPFPIQGSELRNPNYIPKLDSVNGSFTEIRRFSALRAYHDSGSFSESEVSSDSRLIGRSVWNTEWFLIIPGGTLLNNADDGLDRFIDSVEDIKIFFQTYAYSGN